MTHGGGRCTFFPRDATGCVWRRSRAAMIDKDERILSLVKKHGRYAAEAYAFVFESLDYTLRKRGGPRRPAEEGRRVPAAMAVASTPRPAAQRRRGAR